MDVIIEKDCLQRPDGSFVCYDKVSGKIYRFTKEELDPDTVSDAELAGLFRLNLKTENRI